MADIYSGDKTAEIFFASILLKEMYYLMDISHLRLYTTFLKPHVEKEAWIS